MTTTDPEAAVISKDPKADLPVILCKHPPPPTKR